VRAKPLNVVIEELGRDRSAAGAAAGVHEQLSSTHVFTSQVH